PVPASSAMPAGWIAATPIPAVSWVPRTGLSEEVVLSAPPIRRGPVSAPLVFRRISMAVPKRKTSPSRRGMRRSADALKAPTYVEDKDSGELRRPHHIDLKTGMYRGRQILEPKDA